MWLIDRRLKNRSSCSRDRIRYIACTATILTACALVLARLAACTLVLPSLTACTLVLLRTRIAAFTAALV